MPLPYGHALTTSLLVMHFGHVVPELSKLQFRALYPRISRPMPVDTARVTQRDLANAQLPAHCRIIINVKYEYEGMAEYILRFNAEMK
jgi:hypothetical protein